MESEVSFTRLVRAIFDAFQGMTRTSAVVSDQTESEAVLHRNRNDGDDEDVVDNDDDDMPFMMISRRAASARKTCWCHS